MEIPGYGDYGSVTRGGRCLFLPLWAIKINIKVFLAKGEDRLRRKRTAFDLAPVSAPLGGRCPGSHPAFHTPKT